MAKTKAEKAYEERREAWRQQQYKRGRKIVSQDEYDNLCDMVSLVGLAYRRAGHTFAVQSHKAKLLALWKEMNEERAKTSCYTDFDREEAESILPENVVLFSQM